MSEYEVPLFSSRRYRVSLTRTGRLTWYWEVEYESHGCWWRVGLFDDRMWGWSLSRRSALRRADRKLGRYVARMDAGLLAHREFVPLPARYQRFEGRVRV